jgi:hypothetical protein
MPTPPEEFELFRFGEVAYDVAQIFGVTTEQGLSRARRALNRAIIDIAGHDRKWSWLRTKTSLETIATEREYSLDPSARPDIQQFWMTGANRGVIDRVPTGKFVRNMPDPESYSGNPYLFDYEGVDSSGLVVVSFFPTPASAIEIFYRFTRHPMPIKDESKDIRVAWGIPPNMLETLTQRAAMLMVQGVNGERYDKMKADTDLQIKEAYAADQAKPGTIFRAPMHGGPELYDGDPLLPSTFGRG